MKASLVRSGLGRGLTVVSLAVWLPCIGAAGTLLISNGSPVKILVPTTDLGTGWRAPSFDDSGWQEGTNGVGFEAVPVEFGGVVIADSEADWSIAGRQGENNWIYGFYDQTADPERTYTADKFQPFRRSDEPWGPANFWDGSAWNWYAGDPPWDYIGQTAIHPNGTNSAGVEHWVIRRWRSTVAGPVTLQFHLRKANEWGNGVTGKIFKNGVELFSRAIAGSDQTGFTVLIPTTVAVGDYVDFVQTPVGADGDGNDGFDGSYMIARVLAGTLVEPVAVADTLTGWGSGAQGENNWYYGFWNKSADPDEAYNPTTDFNNTDPNWTFAGWAWVLGPGDPPWDFVGQTDWHPNGPDPIHWAIKRWVATADGDYSCRVQFAKQNPWCGNGTTLHVLHNGVEKAQFTVAFNDTKGVDSFAVLTGVLAGDLIEFALDPTGTDGQPGDACDGSRLVATIYPSAVPWMPSLRPLINTDMQSQMLGANASVYLRFPFTVENPDALETLRLKLNWNDGYVLYLNGVLVDKKNTPTVIEGSTVADSLADWSPTGEQGYRGWVYGYYDRSLDPDGTYGLGDLTLFSSYWNGSGWDLLPTAGAPWTELYQETAHPNSPNGGPVNPDDPATHEHWVVRRWNSTVDSATLKCRFKFRKTNPNCGDGVTGYIFVNGVMVYSNTIAYNDSVGRDDVVDLPEVLVGDPVDIVIAPGNTDWCDGHAFSVTIFEGTPSVPWDAAATARRTATGPTRVPTSLDLTEFLPLLNRGRNVLAVQALNVSKDDGDVLFVAELEANRKPVAADDTAVTLRDVPTQVGAELLLANDTDPDGDTAMLVGVTPSGLTTAGGQVQLLGQTVHYTPPAGYTGLDSFTYTITDASGTPVQATVNVAVAPGQIQSIRKTAEGSYVVVIPGVAGVNYTLQRATELPTTTWVAVDGPKQVGAEGVVELVDTEPPSAQAFYRVMMAPAHPARQ